MIDGAPQGARSQLGTLRTRLAEQKLNVAVVGQFKRGKSTLLNALLGEELSPMGILPLTAVPVFVRAGRVRQIVVNYLDRRPPAAIASISANVLAQKLRELVSEDCNPKNRLGIETIEVHHPASILGDGVVLIDTPGIGSTLEHNTEAAVALLPKCDTALFVVSPDPPITKQEIAFLKQVQPHAQRIVVVLNKMDLLSESDAEISLRFLRTTLKEAGLGSVPAILGVSAKKALVARRTGDGAALRQSGLPALETHLFQSIVAERQTLLAQSVVSKALQILELLRTSLTLSLRVVDLEADDLQQRLAAFTDAMTRVEAECSATQDVLVGDRKRLLNRVEEKADALRTVADDELKRTAIAKFTITGRADDALVAVEHRIPVLFEAARQEWQAWTILELQALLNRHATALAALLEQIQGAAAQIFDTILPDLASPQFVSTEREPYWIKAKIDPIFGPLVSGLVDSLLPPDWHRRRVRDRILARCHQLVVTNVENLRWSTRQSIEATLLQFSNQFDRYVADAARTIEAAVHRTLTDRRDLAETSVLTVELLRHWLELLNNLAEQVPAQANAAGPQAAPRPQYESPQPTSASETKGTHFG